jgi:hypothetical protein
MGHALFKGCKAYLVLLTPLTCIHAGDAGLDHLGGSRRASREAVARGVTPLDKDRAIAGEACLAINGFTTR